MSTCENELAQNILDFAHRNLGFEPFWLVW
jgi:hypothetical protein